MRFALRLLAPLSLAALASACLSVDFDPASVVSSVRIFASKANKPFAKPGDTVEIEVLAYDGRPDKVTRPMQIFWVPLPCINPTRDLYYLCFAQLAAQQTQSSGAASGPSIPLRPGLDLTDLLPKGPKFSFTLPKDIVSSHPPTPGAGQPYGLAIVFNIACAGRVKLDEPGENPQSIPLGCFDDQGNRLGADDYVIGFTRVYAYDDRANENPIIEGATFDGKPIGEGGIVVDHCVKEKFKDCEEKPIGISVADGSWEINERSTDGGGRLLREQIWATYYGTLGRFDSETRLLFDPARGRIGDSDNKLKIPREPGKGLLWIVVRDNRGGTAWREIPITVR